MAGDYDALVFDVIGTVVDERGTIEAELSGLLETKAAVEELAADWSERLETGVARIARHQLAWRGNSELRRDTLTEALDSEPGPEAARLRPHIEALAGVGERLRPWPGSPAALARLRQSHLVVALTNSDPRQIAALSRAGGLSWHFVLTSDLARSYKPDPEVYRLTLRVLDPARSLFVAAHPWDLRAAAEHGFHTAYVARPGAPRPGPDDRFDLTVADFGELADRLLQ